MKFRHAEKIRYNSSQIDYSCFGKLITILLGKDVARAHMQFGQ